jgi:hypothetical protein
LNEEGNVSPTKDHDHEDAAAASGDKLGQLAKIEFSLEKIEERYKENMKQMET